jgi:hypothetical protein
MVADDACEGSERLIHGGCVREHLGDVRLQDHDVAACHPGSVGVAFPFTEVVFGKDVVRASTG